MGQPLRPRTPPPTGRPLLSYLPPSSKLTAMLEKHQSELIEHAMAVGALKFGSFTLKSGRYRSHQHLKLHLDLMDQNFRKHLPILF